MIACDVVVVVSSEVVVVVVSLSRDVLLVLVGVLSAEQDAATDAINIDVRIIAKVFFISFILLSAFALRHISRSDFRVVA